MTNKTPGESNVQDGKTGTDILLKELNLTDQEPRDTKRLAEVRTKQIMLGETEYTLKELPRPKNIEWRAKFKDLFGHRLAEVFGLALARSLTTEGEATAAIMSLFDTFEDLLDEAVELLFEFSDDLSAKRASIEDVATEYQLIVAFQMAVQLALPFEWKAFNRQAMRLMNSFVSQAIMPNLPRVNGESAPKKSTTTAKRKSPN